VGPVFGEDFADDVWDPAFTPKGEARVESNSVRRPILAWCSLATGALLAGGAMLVAIGLLGDALPTVRGGYPTVPGLLFDHPVMFPAFLSVGAAVLVLVTGLVVRPRGVGAVASVITGLVSLFCIGVVAVSALNIIQIGLTVVRTAPGGELQFAR
jgi:hypothetical protein